MNTSYQKIGVVHSDEELAEVRAGMFAIAEEMGLEITMTVDPMTGDITFNIGESTDAN